MVDVRRLREAIKDGGGRLLRCIRMEPTVRISKHKAFVPDASGGAIAASLAFDSLEIPNPIIVVEVLSPSTVRMDTTTKLDGYFRVASVKHYLIVDPETRTVTHHKRGRGGG